MIQRKKFKEIKVAFFAYEYDNLLLASTSSQSTGVIVDSEEGNWTPFF